MKTYELRPTTSKQQQPNAEQLTWAQPDDASASIDASDGPWLHRLGTRNGLAIDLVRVAVAAYIADRLTRRPKAFMRSIGLHVQMVDPERWRQHLDFLADLLHWASGDSWQVDVSAERRSRPSRKPRPQTTSADVVALLSGGLDSFCGVVLADPEAPRLLLSHADNTIVKGAQNRVTQWLSTHTPTPFPNVRVALTQRCPKRESSSRSRSLLFLSLAVAAADAVGSMAVEVPENGFTSLNPPLAANRGGALSTRSTHPTTLYRFNTLLEQLGLPVRVTDPYSALTKGEFLARAAAAADDAFPQGAAKSLSCGKLDGARYKNGNGNEHCGLCFPCIVRRAAFIAAGVTDQTVYLSERLGGAARQKLIANRSDDVSAVRWAVEHGIDDVALLAAGPYPPEFDFDAALDLCERGLAELAAVPLP